MKPRTDMKKYLIIMACALAIAGCKQKQGQTAGDTAAADSVKTEVNNNDVKQFTPAEIGSGWASKDIAVAGGGEQPDIVTLLKAFGQVWPTESLDLLLGMAVDRVDQFDHVDNVAQQNPDTGGGMMIDYNNGYADVTPGDAPGDILRAAVWKRTNGHRLLGIFLCTPDIENNNLPKEEALCFYDYDPKTATMTPEKDNPVSRFKPSQNHFTMYEFPRIGRDMMVGDLDPTYNGKWHAFAWDGKTFKEETAYTDEEMEKAVAGLWKSTDKSLPFTFRITPNAEGWPEVSDCAVTSDTEYEAQASVFYGLLTITEQTLTGYDVEDEALEEIPEKDPAVVCRFRMTKDGRLTGGYKLILTGGKVRKGIVTMQKQSQLNDYAE